MKRIIFILVWIPFILLAEKGSLLAIQAKDGKLDLRSRNFSKEGAIRLEGSWNFYPNQALSPNQIKSNILPKKTIKISQKWKEKFGYATYKLTILVDNIDSQYGLYILPIYSNYNLFINGELKKSIGTFGTKKEAAKPEWNSETVFFSTKSPEIEIVIQVSNFWHDSGGITHPIYFGTNDNITRSSIIKFITHSIFYLLIFPIGISQLFNIRKNNFGPFSKRCNCACTRVNKSSLTTGLDK